MILPRPTAAAPLPPRLGRLLRAACLLLAGLACARVSAPPDPERVVFFVNAEPVRQSEFDRALQPYLDEARRRFSADQIRALMPRIREQAREQLILSRVVEQAVAREGIEPGDDQVDAEIAAAESYLRAQGNSLEDYQASQGTTRQAVRDEIRSRLARRMLYDRLLDIQPPDEAACRAEYDAHPDFYTRPAAAQIRQLFVRFAAAGVDPEVRAAAGARAAELRRRLLEGESFSGLQRAAGSPATAADAPAAPLPGAGGSVWITRDSPLPGEVLDAAFGQPIGEIGPLIETLLGCHVVLVSERRDAERLSFLEVRDVIRARLMNQRRESEVPALVRRLRDQAIIRNP